ncbi:MAG: hypothetical protein ACYTKD_29975 [Planctomycetota bacterium]
MSGKRQRWLRTVWKHAARSLPENRKEVYWRTMKRVYRPGMTPRQIVDATQEAVPPPERPITLE